MIKFILGIFSNIEPNISFPISLSVIASILIFVKYRKFLVLVRLVIDSEKKNTSLNIATLFYKIFSYCFIILINEKKDNNELILIFESFFKQDK